MSRGNKHTKAAKPFISSSESKTAQISLICLSLFENIKFSFYSSILLDGLDRFHGDQGLWPGLPSFEESPVVPHVLGTSSPSKSRPPASVALEYVLADLRLFFETRFMAAVD